MNPSTCNIHFRCLHLVSDFHVFNFIFLFHLCNMSVLANGPMMSQRLARDGDFDRARIGVFAGNRAATVAAAVTSNPNSLAITSVNYTYSAVGNMVTVQGNGVVTMAGAGAGSFELALPAGLPGPLLGISANLQVGSGVLAGTALIQSRAVQITATSDAASTVLVNVAASIDAGAALAQLSFAMSYISAVPNLLNQTF